MYALRGPLKLGLAVRCFAFPTGPLSCCCSNSHPWVPWLSRAGSTEAAVTVAVTVTPSQGSVCLTCRNLPARSCCAQPLLLSSTRQFVHPEKRKRKPGEMVATALFYFRECFSPGWQPRAAQLLLLLTSSHVSKPCRGPSFAVALGHQSKETPKASRHSTLLRFKCFRAGRSLNKASVSQQTGKLDLPFPFLQQEGR